MILETAIKYILLNCPQIKLRALLTHLQQLRIGYWGVSIGKGQSLPSISMPSPRSHDASDESQQPAEASGLGRSWVASMFSRERSMRASSFSRASKSRLTTSAFSFYCGPLSCSLTASSSTSAFNRSHL